MSLVHKLHREIKANPAKAAGLGVLLLVAGYFWVPLIRGTINPAGGGVPPTASATAKATLPAAAPRGVPTIAPPPATASAVYDWRRYAKLIDEDAKMRTSAELGTDRDPFASPQLTAPQQPNEPPKVAAEPITPADAGLLLTTTLLSTRKKIAEINGKSYSIGDRVEVASEPKDASFRVVEIYPRRVILESHGKRYELTIPRPLLDAVVEARDADGEPANDNQTADGFRGEEVEHKTGDEFSRPKATDDLTE